MTKRVRIILIVLGSIFVLSTVAIAVTVWQAGMLVVRVHEHGPHGSNIAILLPGIVVPVVLQFVPDRVLEDAARDVSRWGPLTRAVFTSLQRSPDVQLVQVDSPRESVRIEKRGQGLVVDVASAEETVHIHVPIRVLQSVIHRLEGISDNS